MPNRSRVLASHATVAPMPPAARLKAAIPPPAKHRNIQQFCVVFRPVCLDPSGFRCYSLPPRRPSRRFADGVVDAGSHVDHGPAEMFQQIQACVIVVDAATPVGRAVPVVTLGAPLALASSYGG